jgi:dTDP-4-amino-4,6-dideoxygalactose transaminase
MKIPLVDLKAQYGTIKEEVLPAITRVLDNTSFILGDEVASFEREFAEATGVKHAVGVKSGTSAITLAALACGLGNGDEVITVPNTFIATSEAVSCIGCKIKFVDVDEKTSLIDLDALEKAIGPNTKAVIPVHLFGQMCDMKRLREIADKHGLKIIEDSAQAHLAEWNGKQPGHYGDAATYSFYPGKNLGAYGDGGAVATNDPQVAAAVRQLRDHGRGPGEKYTHSKEGFNERLDALQAAILRVKLPYLSKWTDMRRDHAKEYAQKLKPIKGIGLPVEVKEAKHVYHLFVISSGRRDALMAHLKAAGIGAGVHYPIPLHRQKAYLPMSGQSFPVTEKLSQEILSLPMYPEMSSEQIDYVVGQVAAFMDNEGK